MGPQGNPAFATLDRGLGHCPVSLWAELGPIDKLSEPLTAHILRMLELA